LLEKLQKRSPAKCLIARWEEVKHVAGGGRVGRVRNPSKGGQERPKARGFFGSGHDMGEHRGGKPKKKPQQPTEERETAFGPSRERASDRGHEATGSLSG